MSLKPKRRPSNSFDKWLLLFNAILAFNKVQKKEGGKEIDVSDYNKVGKKLGLYHPYWVLHDLEDTALVNKWMEFISNPDNNIVFTESQLIEEKTI